MSPSGRPKYASPPHKRTILLLSIVLLTSRPYCEGLSIPNESNSLNPPKTTPSYDGDYYENGVAENFVGDVVHQKTKVQEEIVTTTSSTTTTIVGEVKKLNEDKVKDNVVIERTYCFGFESKCKCSPDGAELTCKAAGFVQVPSNLHPTLKKM